MMTLLDTCLGLIPLNDFLEVIVKNGLCDTSHDIKISSIQMIYKLAKLRPQFVSNKLEGMGTPLKAMIETKTKTKYYI